VLINLDASNKWLRAYFLATLLTSGDFSRKGRNDEVVRDKKFKTSFMLQEISPEKVEMTRNSLFVVLALLPDDSF
jgi:hypothetical protein